MILRKDRAAAMPFIMLTTLIDMMSIGLMIPVLPALVGSFTDSQTDQALWYGLVTFTFSLANFFASPILGALSDAHGRRPVLLLGFCGLAFSFFATALATALWMLVAVRLVSGAMQANMSVANAYVADITPPEERAKRFGMLGAMFGIGFILGPVMGGLLGAIDLRLPFFAAGSFALLNFLYGWFVLPESLPAERRRAFAWRSANPVSALRGLAQLKGVGMLVAVIACAGSRSSCSTPSGCCTRPSSSAGGRGRTAGRSRRSAWSRPSCRACCMGRLLRFFSPKRLAVLGLLSSTVAYVLWGAATEGWMMFAIIFVNLLGATVAASIQSIISSAVDSRSQGQALGAVGGLNSLMAVVAPVLGAPLLTLVADLPRGDWRIGTPFFFCAALQALALALAVLHFRRERVAG